MQIKNIIRDRITLHVQNYFEENHPDFDDTNLSDEEVHMIAKDLGPKLKDKIMDDLMELLGGNEVHPNGT